LWYNYDGKKSAREVKMADTKHDRIAKRLAKRLGSEYNPVKGPDIKTPREVDEVEVASVQRNSDR